MRAGARLCFGRFMADFRFFKIFVLRFSFKIFVLRFSFLTPTFVYTQFRKCHNHTVWDCCVRANFAQARVEARRIRRFGLLRERSPPSSPANSPKLRRKQKSPRFGLLRAGKVRVAARGVRVPPSQRRARGGNRRTAYLAPPHACFRSSCRRRCAGCRPLLAAPSCATPRRVFSSWL